MVKTLSKGFVKQMFQASERISVNLRAMTDKEIRAEYTKQSKVANKRIKAIEKAGYNSPSVNNLRNNEHIQYFGLKNQNLTDIKEVKKAYKKLMTFLNDDTSSKSGIRKTLDTMIKNFGIHFNGDYVALSHSSSWIFAKYKDLKELDRKGQITLKTVDSDDKIEVVNAIDELYNSGQIDKDTSPSEIYELLKDALDERLTQCEDYDSLNFRWKIR